MNHDADIGYTLSDKESNCVCGHVVWDCEDGWHLYFHIVVRHKRGEYEDS